jgi:hypothetical protein
MKRHFLKGLLACSVMAKACIAIAATGPFSFGIIAHPFMETPDESILREAITETDSDNLAFVVANGIKSPSELCSDNIYDGRKALLDSAKNGLIVSLAASDWTDCKGQNGKSAAIGRLNQLRELFFSGDMSLGASKIPLVRQSATAKFRNYGENARWEFGKAMFATVNLPENNNHYLIAAGRNSEFEDRLVANRDWLNRVFTYAKLKKLSGIVLFCDGNPLSQPRRTDAGGTKRDGFAEIRQQINGLAAKFPGKVLVVHGRTGPEPKYSTNIVWRNNLGVLETGLPWTKVRVDPSLPTLFAVARNSAMEAKTTPSSNDTIR